MNNRTHEDFDSSEFGKRILEEMRQENEQVDPGFPDFIGCGSNSCFLDRPAPGKSNGKGACECFAGLPTIKRLMVMKYIRREQARRDKVQNERNLLAQLVRDAGYIGCEAAGGWCRHCQKTIGTGHKEGCLVEMAERILKEG